MEADEQMMSGQSRTASTLLSTCVAATLSFSPTKSRHVKLPLVSSLSPRLFCSCSHAHSVEHPIDITNYKQAFSRRMAMAGLKPQHRIGPSLSNFSFIIIIVDKNRIEFLFLLSLPLPDFDILLLNISFRSFWRSR